MEIEAKFAIANRQAYRALLRLRTIGEFALRPTGHVKMADRYYDTATGRLLEAGYTCRIRFDDKGILATLKGLGGVQGALHRRDEQEVRLSVASIDPSTWPSGPARDLALTLTGGQPLQPLFDLEQDRARAEIVAGDRRIAELSLDEVRAAVGRRPAFYYELEVELLPDGTEAELATVAAIFETEYGLTPETRSKFERALAVLRTRGTAVQSRLDEDELGRIQAFLNSGDVELSRRAGAVLGWAEGLPTREIVTRTGLSSSRIRFWLRQWRQRRFGIFDADENGGKRSRRRARDAQTTASDGAAGESSPLPSASAPLSSATDTNAARLVEQSEPVGATRPAPRRKSGLLTVAEFAAEHRVDLPHAKHVGNLAVALFDGLRRAHRLPRKRRKLLRQAALLAGIGVGEGGDRRYRIARDMVLAQPLHNVDTADRLMLACILAFQREKFKPDREPTMQALTPKQRQQALLLAALLQIAAALDAARTSATLIEGIEDCETETFEIRVVGPRAEMDALQATQRSALWQHLTGRAILFTPQRSTAASGLDSAAVKTQCAPGEPPPAAPPIEIASLRADDPMSEGGRKILLTHFLKMVANEAGTRLGADIECLHDMRVSTRRMRAAYRLFAPYYEADALDQFNKDLRRTGRLLGAVRDMDVLLEAAERYQAEDPGHDLAPLIESWHARRDLARLEMLDYLNNSAYTRFVERFRAFLTTPGAGELVMPPDEPRPHQVRHVAPRIIFERYEQVRAYEVVLAGPATGIAATTYHTLRIEFKGLRYALEFFKDVLGPETPDLIKQVTALQDVLGALQDAHVAEWLITEFLTGQVRRRKKESLVSLSGVEHYLIYQLARQEELLQQFPTLWIEIIGRPFRRLLAAAVAAP